MIAAPLGGGRKKKCREVARIAAYAAGTVVGGVACLVAGHTILRTFGGLPAVAVAAVCILAAFSVSRLLPNVFPSSRWRVPRRWSTRLGQTGFAAAFGLSLGLGFLTALPSASLYAVVAAASLFSTTTALAVGLAFGTARFVPVLAAALAQRRVEQRAVMGRLRTLGRSAIPADAFLVAALGLLVLISDLRS